MARARLLKPGFFSNDRLAEASLAARLLFAGLWTVADREGRLEDRPKRIKAGVLPYDDVDVDLLLDELALGGFVVRYEVAGQRLIQVVTFAKHQSPHPKEPASQLPAMGESVLGNGPDTVLQVSSQSVAVAGSSGSSVARPSGSSAAAAAAVPRPRLRTRSPAAAASEPTGNETLDFLLTKFPKTKMNSDLRAELCDIAGEYDLAALMLGVAGCKRDGVLPFPSHLRQHLPIVDRMRY